MVADIGPPEFESRVAILRQKCEDHSFENIHDSVLSHIAEIVQTNIRELEGTLIRLVTESSVFDEELTVEFAARVLSPLTTQPPIPSPKAVTADDIQSGRKLF
jgi:chromosomal replication initiator protein